MAVIESKLKSFTIDQSCSIQKPKLCYPLFVIFETIDSFRIINLESKNGDLTDKIYKTCERILDSDLQMNLLWLILESGEIKVVDLLSGSQIKVSAMNYFKLHLCHGSITRHKSMVFKSDGGELLTVPYSNEYLTKQINENPNTELSVNLKKVHHSDIEDPIVTVNGLQLSIEEGNLQILCPITGQYEILSSSIKLEHILLWDEMLILANDSKMFLVDLENSSVLYEFGSCSYYQLITVHNNIFYYLAGNDTEVFLCHAILSHTLTSDGNDKQNSSSQSSSQESSQEALVSELKILIESLTCSGKMLQIDSHLLKLFEMINDFTFLINSSVKLYQHNIVFKQLFYILQKRLYDINDQKLLYKIADIIIKVDLLEYINFQANHSYQDIDLFEKCYKELCVLFLSKSDLDLASMCWLKYSGMQLNITADDVMDILKSIPHNTKMSAIIIWLKNFAPNILELNPFYIDTFVRWAMERIFILEQSSYWPKIGIKFIEEIIRVLESSLKLICVRPISMDDLDILKDRINYITELKEKYKINVLLSELSSQSPNEVAIIMLRRCYTEDLDMFLQNYLPNYATRHTFDIDDILQTFIESETASSGGTVDGGRLELLLNAFRSPARKLECLLHVLKALDVPWSTTVNKVAIKAASTATKDFTASDPDRILAQEIQKELNYANVKVVLKKYNFPLTCTDYTLVLHKVVNSNSVDLNDLRSIITVMSSYADYGNALYVNKCLENCDSRSALDYFQTLPRKEKNVLLKTTMVKYEQIINATLCNKMIERNYIDFMKGTNMLNATLITSIESLYYLKNSYDIKLNMNDIYIEHVCNDKIKIWLRQSIEDKTICGRGGSIFKLIPNSLPRCRTISKFLRTTSASHKVRSFVEYLINSPDNLEDLSQLLNCEDNTMLVDSYNLLIEIIEKCYDDNLHELIKHLTFINALINSNVIIKNLTIAWKFNYIFLPISSRAALCEFVNFTTVGGAMEHLNKYPSLHNKCDFIPFRIISNMVIEANINSLSSASEILTQIINLTTKKLLSKVVAAQEFDELLATVLLVLDKSTSNDFSIIETLRGSNESVSPTHVCFLSSPPIRRTFVIDSNLYGHTVVYPPKYILKTKFNINLSEISLPENTEETWDVKVILFYVLKQYPNTPCERLVELCRALNVSLNDGLSLQLISILTTWDLKYEVISDELNCRQIKIENNLDLLNKCLIIWENIGSKDFLRDVLKDFWRNGEVTLHGRTVSVNPYYYEVFLCIYNLLHALVSETNTTKDYYLLNFLKDYKRISAPKQYEFELFSVKGMFPEIGYYRLPFHLFKREDMWSNLKSEITLETYERWLPVVSLLSLDSDLQIAKDMICSNALKQTMTSRQRSTSNEGDLKENEPWRLLSREEPLLRAAHRCVKHIANMEWAGACLFYVLQGCSRGADQVDAAQLCYQFAQRWAALQPGNRAVKQMERLHATLSTRHVLHKIEWTCDEFVRLSTEPAQLIRTLYLHPDFVNKIARHDVNRAANEIADKNNINISSIRIQILENLLDKSGHINKGYRTALESKELIIAKYILKATCPKMGAIYLSRIAFDEDSDYNKSKKMRALQCLISVVDQDTSIKVTNKERDALWTSLKELYSVVKLENIDMPWVVITFTQDKCRALEQLMQIVDGNIDGLKITANLAHQFGNTQIIRNLIPLLMRSHLYEDMIPLLMKICSPPDSLIYSAWRAAILSPFQTADYPITEKQKNKCINAINLLPICPVIKDEDLKEVWRNCVRLKCLGLGCLVLPYMTHQARQSLNELQKIDRRNLIASLKNLHSDTFLVSGAMHVVESMATRVYKH